MSRTIHDLKTIPPYFSDVYYGRKTFEVRNNDRNFQVGDLLRLREYTPTDETFMGGYTGSACIRKITYILNDDKFLQPGYVVLGIENATSKDLDEYMSRKEVQE